LKLISHYIDLKIQYEFYSRGRTAPNRKLFGVHGMTLDKLADAFIN